MGRVRRRIGGLHNREVHGVAWRLLAEVREVGYESDEYGGEEESGTA